MAYRRGEVSPCGREWLAVRAHLVLEARTVGSHSAAAHDGAADDEGRLPDGSLGLGEGCADRVAVAAVDREDLPAPGAVLGRYILAIDFVYLGRELDVIGIVVHDEVVQPEVSRDAASALRDLLLDPPVGDVGIDRLAHDPAETLGKELRGDGCTDSEGMSLTEGPRGVLDAALYIYLRMPRRGAAPLAELLELLHIELADQCQLCVEHRGHVPGVEEEAVAP